jgi:UDP-N-acetylglucosamine 1-carboxyvinyltransferase
MGRRQGDRTSLEPRIVLEGGSPLFGTIPISGSKNAALAVLAGTVLASEGVTIVRNLPRIHDIEVMASILRELGCVVVFEDDGKVARIDASGLENWEVPDSLASKMRASLHLLGPVLARLGRARIPQPGGCSIGARPIDLHLKGLTALGAAVDSSIFAEAPVDGLRGGQVFLDKPSVGATMNLMMAAAMADGETVIENAAQEPDIEDLAQLINAMGGDIRGAGTGMLTVHGVKKLHGADFTVSPDRIEAGSMALIAAVTGGDITLTEVNTDHLRPILMKIEELGMKVDEPQPGQVHITHPGGRLKATNIKAMPHPGFPTDLQQPFAVALALADGVSHITDTVYEGRFRYLSELGKLGVNAEQIDGRTAIVTGVSGLHGGDVEATDLRAGAAMVLAGLAATGQTRVFNLSHIDRGYERLVEKLRGVGARIWRENELGERC